MIVYCPKTLQNLLFLLKKMHPNKTESYVVNPRWYWFSYTKQKLWNLLGKTWGADNDEEKLVMVITMSDETSLRIVFKSLNISFNA